MMITNEKVGLPRESVNLTKFLGYQVTANYLKRRETVKFLAFFFL